MYLAMRGDAPNRADCPQTQAEFPLLRRNEQWEHNKMSGLDTCLHIDDSLASVNIYRHSARIDQSASICTNATLTQRDRYPQVTNVCPVYKSWERSQRYSSPSTENTVQF